MVVTIHQPEHLPWLGFFDKARQADILVLLDTVQFRKNYYQNRNRIRSDTGTLWLTVPVLTRGNLDQAIKEVRINNQGSPRWREKCWASLVQHYRKAQFWKDHEPFFRDLYRHEWVLLSEMNEHIIRYMFHALSIGVRLVKSSEMNARGQKGDLLLNICQEAGADTYLSGVSGREYLDASQFSQACIELHFQQFHHPIYQQLYEPFIPCMSSIDLLLNYGPESLNVIRGVGVKTMDQVFQ